MWEEKCAASQVPTCEQANSWRGVSFGPSEGQLEAWDTLWLNEGWRPGGTTEPQPGSRATFLGGSQDHSITGGSELLLLHSTASLAWILGSQSWDGVWGRRPGKPLQPYRSPQCLHTPPGARTLRGANSGRRHRLGGCLEPTQALLSLFPCSSPSLALTFLLPRVNG